MKHAIPTNPFRFSLNKGRPRCYAKPPTAPDVCQSIQGLASLAARVADDVVFIAEDYKDDVIFIAEDY